MTINILTCRGLLTAEQLRAAAEAAERFGAGNAQMDSQGSLKIPDVPEAKAEECREFLAAHGLVTGGMGRHIRPVSACSGTACRHGMIDTDDLAREIHERFVLGWRDVTLPAKLKIGVGGCPNNCAMPNLCDIGIVGAQGGYRLLLGGRGGRKLPEGRPAEHVFKTKDELLQTVERLLKLYRDQGQEKERFGSMLERLGFETVCREAAGPDI